MMAFTARGATMHDHLSFAVAFVLGVAALVIQATNSEAVTP
jgi:hypothetical protein